MEKYTWIEKYSVGVKEIDRQHQHFLDIVDEVIKMTGGKPISVEDLLAKITDLNDYAIYHFETEEKIFKDYDYSDAKEHIEAHEAYREQMDQFWIQAKKEGADTKKVAFQIAEFAGSWLINHIMIMDQKYTDFMHDNGIK
ncbi:MAG: bacteriohemerythrin [Candidatus Zambryskibacteria bacterium]